MFLCKNLITYDNYFINTKEFNIYTTTTFDKIYDDTKQTIAKIDMVGNFTNTTNKNKMFFQYNCEKCDNVQPLPLGITPLSYNNISKISACDKTILCSSQMSKSGNRNSLPNFSFVTYFKKESNLSYLQNIASSKYVLSPHGDYPDCYRHYEAMYLSAIPITIRHPKLYFLEDMPTLLLNDWSELTEELLISSYDTIINKSREKLDINYWIDLMKDAKWTE